MFDYARSVNGRLPTAAEAKLILQVEGAKVTSHADWVPVGTNDEDKDFTEIGTNPTCATGGTHLTCHPTFPYPAWGDDKTS